MLTLFEYEENNLDTFDRVNILWFDIFSCRSVQKQFTTSYPYSPLGQDMTQRQFLSGV